MKVRDLISLPEEDGWHLVRTRGSHRQLKHDVKPGTITVAGKNSVDVPRGTLNGILKRAGLKRCGADMRYAVVVETGESGFGAYVPDLPGCVAAAESYDEVLKLIQGAIEFHIDGLKEDGEPIPAPTSRIEFVDVAA